MTRPRAFPWPLAAVVAALAAAQPAPAQADPVPAFAPYWEVYQSGRDLAYPDWAPEADFYTVVERFPRYEQARAAMLLLVHKHPGYAVDIMHIYGPEIGQWDFLEYWLYSPDDADCHPSRRPWCDGPALVRQIWFDTRERCYDQDGGCTRLHREPRPFHGRYP